MRWQPIQEITVAPATLNTEDHTHLFASTFFLLVIYRTLARHHRALYSLYKVAKKAPMIGDVMALLGAAWYFWENIFLTSPRRNVRAKIDDISSGAKLLASQIREQVFFKFNHLIVLVLLVIGIPFDLLGANVLKAALTFLVIFLTVHFLTRSYTVGVIMLLVGVNGAILYTNSAGVLLFPKIPLVLFPIEVSFCFLGVFDGFLCLATVLFSVSILIMCLLSPWFSDFSNTCDITEGSLTQQQRLGVLLISWTLCFLLPFIFLMHHDATQYPSTPLTSPQPRSGVAQVVGKPNFEFVDFVDHNPYRSSPTEQFEKSTGDCCYVLQNNHLVMKEHQQRSIQEPEDISEMFVTLCFSFFFVACFSTDYFILSDCSH